MLLLLFNQATIEEPDSGLFPAGGSGSPIRRKDDEERDDVERQEQELILLLMLSI